MMMMISTLFSDSLNLMFLDNLRGFDYFVVVDLKALLYFQSFEGFYFLLFF